MIIKNQELNIDEKEPFKEDKLGREKGIGSLTQLIDNCSDSFVLAVDSAWGTGKTTFVKMWQQYLENEGFPVIYYNAWESDFSNDALASILGEIGTGLESLKFEDTGGNDLVKKFDNVKKVGARILKKSHKVVFNILAANLGIEGLKEEITKISEDIVPESIEKYQEDKAALTELRKSLEAFANSIREAQNKPLVIFIDELDRCRPTFAIEVLEKVKHIFSIPNINFVIAIDKDQLCHSIRSVYGAEFDASGYLKRFIDITYKLPTGSQEQYLVFLFHRFKLLEFLGENKPEIRGFTINDTDLYLLLNYLFRKFNYGLRDQEQFVAHLNVVLKTYRQDKYIPELFIVMLLVLKHEDMDFYKRLISFRFELVEFETKVKKLIGDIEPNYLFDVVLGNLYKSFSQKRSYSQEINQRFERTDIPDSFDYDVKIDEILAKIELNDRIEISGVRKD